jgi:hypothetical protein
MSKLIVKPLVYKEKFCFNGKTYYLTLRNQCLISYHALDTYLPIFNIQNNFCEIISKKEYLFIKKEYENSLITKINNRIQLTLF